MQCFSIVWPRLHRQSCRWNWLASTNLSAQSLQSPPTNRDLGVQLLELRARLWGDDLVSGIRSSSLTEISEERFPMAHILDVLFQLS
ncbi:hypothetical protein Plhal304r1_c023g0079981 [Plasmopara halstedii]